MLKSQRFSQKIEDVKRSRVVVDPGNILQYAMTIKDFSCIMRQIYGFKRVSKDKGHFHKFKLIKRTTDFTTILTRPEEKKIRKMHEMWRTLSR
jgi:hypothetical protein